MPGRQKIKLNKVNTALFGRNFDEFGNSN